MGPVKKYQLKGREVLGQAVDFEAKGEAWSSYALEDGTVLKIKTVLLDVVRLEEYNENGDPVYQCTAHQIVGVVVPDELKRRSG